MRYNYPMKHQDDFVATVSHELRTPLTSIRGFAQTLLTSWDKISDNDKQKFIKIIEEQSNRLIGLVENILTVSSNGSDKPVLKKVNITKALEPVVKLLTQKYSDHQIITEINPKLPEGNLDEEKFQQILTNLIENACKYSTSGSKVLVKIGFAENKEGFFTVKIIDNGVGILAEHKTKIFEKFARIDNPLTRTVQGNGLGLYITKSLVEMMDGEIDFESSKEGTTFIVQLPLYNPEVQICSATY